MAILKVSHLGNPVLRKTAAQVDPAELETPELQRFLDDMVDTMREYDGIGLAAPQVHASRQIAVIDGELLHDDPKVPEAAKQLLVLVNPVMRFTSPKRHLMWEGCLSVPGLRARVPRQRELELEALDRHGQPLHLAATGYFAGVIQHELDHLAGKVYLDRLPDLSTLTYLKEFKHFWVEDSDADDELVTGS
jgi:peptide deformylase